MGKKDSIYCFYLTVFPPDSPEQSELLSSSCRQRFNLTPLCLFTADSNNQIEYAPYRFSHTLSAVCPEEMHLALCFYHMNVFLVLGR